MPRFAYVARSREGHLVEDQLEASSAEAVATQLGQAGVVPIRIAPVRERFDVAGMLRRWFTEERVTLEELFAFCRNMHVLVRAGVPIVRAISGLAESARNPALARALRDVVEALRGGHMLSAALSRHPQVFSTLFASVVQVGENTGRLDEAFQQLGRHLDLERETRRRISTATRYPLMVIGAVGLALGVINVFVIPVFADTFASFGAELPWATQLLIATSDLFVRGWPWMVVAAGGGVVGFRQWVATEAGRERWDCWKLRAPVLGSIVLRALLGRYARSFSMTFRAGLPILQTLEVVARSVDNAWIAGRVREMCRQIERGEPLGRSAAGMGLFSPLVLQMIAVGEETGNLGEMHLEIALAYEAEVEYDLRRLSDLMEPMLLVGVGGVVLLLALGVYLPLWSMSAGLRPG
jgi:MSHA biogenesis protein MshG